MGIWNLSRRQFAVLLAAAITLAALPAAAAPITLLSVGGTQDTGVTISAGEAAAVSFTLTQAATNVTIDASVFCLDCSGGIWFQRDSIGAGASFGDSLDSAAFSSATTHPYFTFASLDPGLYFLIVSIDSGSGIWSGSTTPAIESNGATRELDFQAASIQPFAPQSNFGVVFGTNLNFAVTAEVPEPASWALMIAGLSAVGLCRRRAACGSPLP